MSSNQTTNYGLHQWQPGDTFLRSEINENFAALDAAVADGAKVLTGSYQGDGVNGRFIDLGATPRAVIVKRPGNASNYNHTSEVTYAPSMAAAGVTSNTLNVVEGGFRVSNHGLVNGTGDTFLYIAIL